MTALPATRQATEIARHRTTAFDNAIELLNQAGTMAELINEFSGQSFSDFDMSQNEDVLYIKFFNLRRSEMNAQTEIIAGESLRCAQAPPLDGVGSGAAALKRLTQGGA